MDNDDFLLAIIEEARKGLYEAPIETVYDRLCIIQIENYRLKNKILSLQLTKEEVKENPTQIGIDRRIQVVDFTKQQRFCQELSTFESFTERIRGLLENEFKIVSQLFVYIPNNVQGMGSYCIIAQK